MASPDRTEGLGNVSAPTLVIHGAPDPLVTVSGGEATAKAVPGADLLIFDDMGHDMPEPRVPEIVAAIAANAKKANR
jgi:pimeloyl-ACP methyl ester carboxylesterase